MNTIRKWMFYVGLTMVLAPGPVLALLGLVAVIGGIVWLLAS